MQVNAGCPIAQLKVTAPTRQCLSRRIPDQPTLTAEVRAWQTARNRKQKGVDWQFTTAKARVKLKHLYPKNHL